MSLLRAVSPTDALFLASILLLWVSLAAHWWNRPRYRRGLGAVGWGAFALFWGAVAVDYLTTSRYFLGSIGTVTVLVSAYAGSLVARGSDLPRSDEDLGVSITFAFAVMGVTFSVFEYVDPVHRLALGAVAAHTAIGLELLGLSPIVAIGPQGYANVIYFEGLSPAYSISIVSACSGISAMTLFAGLVVATDASRRRKTVAAVGIVGLIYVLNVVRAMFVGGAMAGEWFAFSAGLIAAIFGVTDPTMASYYFAEYFVAQVLVVVVLLGVYGAFSAHFPEIQDLVEGFLDSARADAATILGR